MLLNDSPLSLLINMASTPSIGVKSKDDNNMYKKKKNKYLYFVWNGNCAKPTYITPYR